MVKKLTFSWVISLTKRYIFNEVKLNVYTVVIKFYCIFVIELHVVFTFKNHFEFLRVVRTPCLLQFWKFLGGVGSSKTPGNGESLGGGGGVQMKESSVGGMDIIFFSGAIDLVFLVNKVFQRNWLWSRSCDNPWPITILSSFDQWKLWIPKLKSGKWRTNSKI